MLSELSIKNFAIIDSISLSFDDGFTVLTGETGAGKSIIIDAIQLLIGGRGSAEYVRHDAEKAEIEGLFLLDENHAAVEKLKEFGIEPDEGTLILKRDIYSNGKSVCRINSQLVTLSVLREIGTKLVDIHGQHETQELMNERNHLFLLDEFAGEPVKEALADYRALYRRYADLKKEWKNLSENEQQLAQRLDLLKFQWKEIADARLEPGEDEALEAERKKFIHFERLYQSLSAAYDALSGEGKAMDWLGIALSQLENAAEIDPSWQRYQENFSSSYYALEDIMHQLHDRLDEMEYDPERIHYVESRLDEIHRLKRKYGKTVAEILDYHGKIAKEIEKIENKESTLSELENKIRAAEAELRDKANRLTGRRKQAAEVLTSAIQKELKALYMDKTVFKTVFHEAGDHLTENGADRVEFFISTNPGEPPKPLAKIASGGELSRIMLALKTIFSKHQGRTSIIFDEVDTGVSGRVAQAIGEKFYQISVSSQVLSITHLPQVAALADQHYHISKTVVQNRTITSVKKLDEKERVEEIARMLSGAEMTSATEQHAKEMIDLAKKVKTKAAKALPAAGK